MPNRVMSLRNPWLWTIATILAFAALLAILVQDSNRATDRREYAGARRVASLKIINAAQSVLSTLRSAETGQRGYLLTNDPNFLAPYRVAEKQISRDIDRLSELTQRNPLQQRQVMVLHRLSEAKFDEMGITIELARAGRVEEARALVVTAVGKNLMDQARNTIATLLAEERRTLRQREIDVVRATSAYRTRIAMLAASIVLLFVAAALSGIFSMRKVREAARDARARMRAEQEANTTLRELDRLWNLSAEFLCVSDRQGKILRINPSCAATLGERQDDLIGTHLRDRFHPDDERRTLEAFSLKHGGVMTEPVETRVRHKDGSYRIFCWRMLADGDVVFGTARDITEERAAEDALKASQAQLQQSQKMEAVGQLTGGIAHDFNNMLAIVIGALDMLKRRLSDADTQTVKLLDGAAEGASRAAGLTRQLLAFSRQAPLAPSAIDVNALTKRMTELLSRTLGEGVALETVLAGGLWPGFADPSQLESALVNLAVNARDAMEGRGKLTIETANCHLDDEYVRTADGISAGQYVLLAVSDTGPGMPPEVIAKAFDPFFTTKPAGKGTGLGLSQIHGFVRQSGGHIRIYSEVGQGTTVKLYIPRARHAAQSAAAPAQHDELPLAREGETILLVEDEDRVREMGAEALRSLGYGVHHAASADEALRLLELLPQPTLLFTDIVMPGKTGRELADEAVRRWPDLKILYTTGYTRNAVIHNGMIDEGVALLGKPFTIDQLARKVRAVLDGHGQNR